MLSRPQPLVWKSLLWPSGESVLMWSWFRLQLHCRGAVAYQGEFSWSGSGLPPESVPRIRNQNLEGLNLSTRFGLFERFYLRCCRLLSGHRPAETCDSGRRPSQQAKLLSWLVWLLRQLWKCWLQNWYSSFCLYVGWCTLLLTKRLVMCTVQFQTSISVNYNVTLICQREPK